MLAIKKFWKNYVASPFYRWLYPIYFLLIYVFAKIINSLNVSVDNDSFSFYANVCEFVGLFITLHEILLVSDGIKKIKKNVISANSLLVITEIQGKFELVNSHISARKFKTARIYLQFIYNNYNQLIDIREINNADSITSETLTNINVILNDWVLIPKAGISTSKARSQIKIISKFNEILIQSKVNLINQQL